MAVRAHALVAAPVSVAWHVLTDYESISRFIPGIARSPVLLRAQKRLLIAAMVGEIERRAAGGVR